MLHPEKDKKLKGEVLPKIGDEYLKFNDYIKATEYLVEGLTFNRSIKNDNGVLSALNSIATLNLKQNKTNLAEIQLNEAYQLAQSTDDKYELLKNYRLQKELDSIKGAFQSAFQWQSKYFELKSKLDKKESAQIPENFIDLNAADNLIDSTQGSQIKESLESTNKSQDRIRNLKFIIYGLILALIAALSFLIITLFKRKKDLLKVDEFKYKNEQTQLQNENIVKQIADLEEINKVKDRLFSIVSHDLKDSISSIKGFIDLLREEGITQEEFYELIPELSENADNASLLLFNLLNWSKTQMQNLEPNPELFNIQDVFHTKLSLIEQKVEQKRIVIIDETQRELLYADKSMIEIVIQNLLTNAVKFSRTGDIITISNRNQNGYSLICVEDTGVGIAKENLDKLFKIEAFTTVGTKNEKGTGLGLSICKELVELNNGKIWVESTVNVGTKFYVELPRVKPTE